VQPSVRQRLASIRSADGAGDGRFALAEVPVDRIRTSVGSALDERVERLWHTCEGRCGFTTEATPVSFGTGEKLTRVPT
jgi:hypothetical protein